MSVSLNAVNETRRQKVTAPERGKVSGASGAKRIGRKTNCLSSIHQSICQNRSSNNPTLQCLARKYTTISASNRLLNCGI
ncbi:uncharacterized protein PHALS_08471 [Plasmopara halstedii]|uniref:Uncharacterized protein n=1 Tax=Plasmopara halstedii TaxID=4781 RepID=A0A0P1AD46_PLAHL|nr:uncharacterized protein PHALS_08471 [Plasmopara halstedii]CEG38393.1 hypothetical protein PHALS_08471 [Plasmopara halstedii]|eukprot:XP_024574762.1 hypothetical protein PHALS_08471 [Plasmopara halstedii]